MRDTSASAGAAKKWINGSTLNCHFYSNSSATAQSEKANTFTQRGAILSRYKKRRLNKNLANPVCEPWIHLNQSWIGETNFSFVTTTTKFKKIQFESLG